MIICFRFGYSNPVNYNDNELYCGGNDDDDDDDDHNDDHFAIDQGSVFSGLTMMDSVECVETTMLNLNQDLMRSVS